MVKYHPSPSSLRHLISITRSNSLRLGLHRRAATICYRCKENAASRFSTWLLHYALQHRPTSTNAHQMTSDNCIYTLIMEPPRSSTAIHLDTNVQSVIPQTLTVAIPTFSSTAPHSITHIIAESRSWYESDDTGVRMPRRLFGSAEGALRLWPQLAKICSSRLPSTFPQSSLFPTKSFIKPSQVMIAADKSLKLGAWSTWRTLKRQHFRAPFPPMY